MDNTQVKEMAGIVSEDYETEVRYASTEDTSDGQRYQSSDSLAEWRSCEQVENGTPSTSPPYWDTDDDEDDSGPKPSELYGKFTWKIESFSQISKRELRSNAFEVGGYKWYILIYPQGCDVCNHLSLFLCVANHDKLLPGWSHFAQFTIAVVNKDPKKSKYSDTLHRFWKKEHDWGWKKFMELSKVSDGFIVADTLVIKAQVQVIREKSNRPFRCLDSQYRRELVRVYFSNVDQICRRFVEERRGKLSKLIEDRVRWSSFRVFWHGLDLSSRQQMSREKSDGILKVVVKHFFIEKEVTSTLVMDSLYSGLKALESQSKLKKGRASPTELEEMPLPFVFVENDMFILADDVLLLLERAAMEPMPAKDDKGIQSQSSNQNRTKDGNSGDEVNKDSIERDERRLTELGRRTVEIFVLAHIFSRIEVAYQEAVALKRQEELIREEEAAWQAESELKAKRGTEKDKRAKKKQAKQKRNNRKAKDKTKEDKLDETLQESGKIGSPLDERTLENFLLKPVEHISEKIDISEDVSDVTDAGDDVIEAPQPDSEARVSSPSNWDVDAVEFFPHVGGSSGELLNGQVDKKTPSVVDDSSSTCSSDSVPSVVMNGPYKGNSLRKVKEFDSPVRGKSQRAKTLVEHAGHARRDPESSRPAATTVPSSQDATESAMSVSGSAPSLTDRISTSEHLVEKQDVRTLQKRKSVKKIVDGHSTAKTFTAEPPSAALATPMSASSGLQQTRQPSEKHVLCESVFIKEPQSYSSNQTDKLILLETKALQAPSISNFEEQRLTPTKVTATPQESSMSRPSSAPIIPVPEPTVSVASTVHPMPLFSRSVSATGRLGSTEPVSSSSCASQPYAPQSYRNAIMGKTSMAGVPCVIPRPTSSSSSQASTSSMSIPASLPSSIPSSLTRTDRSSVQPGFTLGSVSRGVLSTGSLWTESCSAQEASGSILRDSSLINDTARLDLNDEAPSFSYNSIELGSHANMRQSQCVAPDEFPHLDIIEYLLDEEQQVNGKAASDGHSEHFMNRQYTFPGSLSTADPVLSNGPQRFDNLDRYYDDSVQRMYGSSSGSFEGRMEFSPSHIEPSYGSGPNGLMSSRQWPAGASDHPILGLSALERHGSSYQALDYPNLSRGFNAYNMYRPANGR